MTSKQFYLGITLAAVGGGFIALTANKYLSNDRINNSIPQTQPVRFSNYLSDTSTIVPAGLNFIYAANLVRPGVVNVKTNNNGDD